jgi:hypothetical protein
MNVRFHVPNPPLVWDTEFASPHVEKDYWKNGKGFEV